MLFLLQKDGDKNSEYSIDNQILKNLIEQSHLIHEYISVDLEDFYDIEVDENGNLKEKILKEKDDFPEKYKNAIPLGNIKFVESYYKIFHGIEKEYPLEIPEVLRTDEFLKRKYKIVSFDEIPKSGYFFIKDVSKLKEFSFIGQLDFFITDDMFEDKQGKFDTTLRFNKNHLYQISEVVDILSEYRIFVLDGKIVSMTNYDGNPTILPDIELIKKAVSIYSAQPDSPKSFNIDIAVTPRGTMILETHLISSIGLYQTTFETEFLYAYMDTKDYILNHNHEISKFDNFNTFELKKENNNIELSNDFEL